MRLTLRGRLLFGVLALLNGHQLMWSVEHGEWIGGALAVAMLLLLAPTILRGRVPLSQVPSSSSWVVRAGLAEPAPETRDRTDTLS